VVERERLKMFGRIIAIAVSPACGTCCAGLSLFGVVVCGALSHLFSKKYAYLGEDWKAPGMTHEIAASNLLQAAILYAIFFGLSVVNLYTNMMRQRGRR
jgi:hypothetical protein